MSDVRPICILVVDDEPGLADLAKSFLTDSEDLEVETVSSVSEARTLLGQRHFDAIISDYQMPVEDGIQFLKSLRHKGDDIPFVLFTGRGREEVVIEALNNGADSYLQKGGLPVPVYTELEHRVRKAVQKHRAERALQETAADLREAQEIAHMGRWDLDLVTGQIKWSDGLYTIFDVDPETFNPTHDSFLRFTHPEDRAIVDKAYTESAEKRTPYDFEHRLWLSDGSIKWVSEIGRTLYDDAGSPIRSVGTIQDITERKQNEAALKDASYARRLLEASLDPLLAVDAAGRITDANAATSELTGVAREELIDTDLSRYFTEPQKAKEGYLKAFEEGEVRDHPVTLLGPLGREVEVIFNASVYKDEHERIKGIFVAVHDVTEHKRAEEQLIQFSDRLSLATRAGGVGIWDFDVVNNKLTWDSQMFKLYGITEDKFGGAYEAWKASLHPEDVQRGDEEIQMALRGEREFDTEFRVLWPDGTIRHIQALALVQRDATGRPLRMVGTNWDVTERKIVEKMLHISDRLSLATRAGGVGIWDYDVINNKLTWDDQMFRINGIQKDQFSGAYEAWKAGLFPEDAQRGDEEIQMALRGEKEFDTEFRVLWPDGTVRHIRALAVVQRDASGRPLRMVGTNWDITERKKAEEIKFDKEHSLRKEAEEQLRRFPKSSPQLEEQETTRLVHELQVHQVELEMQSQELRGAQIALEESRDKYLDLYEFAPLGYLTLTEKAMVEGANLTSAALLGIDRGKLIGARFSKFLAEEEADEWHLYFRNVLRHREKQICTLTLRRGDGSTFPARLESIQVSDSSEGRATVRVAISDVTDFHQTEKALQKSEARFDRLAEHSGTITWQVDAQGSYTYVSNVSETVLGYRPDELVGKKHFYDLHPESGREAFKKAALEAFERKGRIHDQAHAMRTKDGRTLWIATNGIPLLDEEGSLLGYQGSDTDITERRRAQESLKEREQYLRMILQTTADGFWMVDSEGKITDVNDAYCRMLGYTRAELLELHIPDIDAALTRDEQAAAIKKIAANGSGVFETKHRRKDGSTFAVELSVTFQNGSGAKLLVPECS